MITWSMPLIQATSVPGRGRSQSAACRVSGMRRGSTTISFAPRCLTARLMYEERTGWFSVVFEPVTSRTCASSMSAIGLVIAPDPNAAARPATVELCQSRAQ